MNFIPSPILSLSNGNFYFNLAASRMINRPEDGVRASAKFDFSAGVHVDFTTLWDDDNPALNYIIYESSTLNNSLRIYSPRLHKQFTRVFCLPDNTSLQLSVTQVEKYLYRLAITEKCLQEMAIKTTVAEAERTIDYSPESNYKFRTRASRKWEQGPYGLF